MELTPESLTERERNLVEAMLRRGQLRDGALPAHREALKAEWGAEMRGLLKAWERLPEDARALLASSLAQRAPVEDPSTLDVGAAARDVLDMIRGRRAAPVPGLREAVAALHQVWIDRGQPPQVRNLVRDREEGRGASELHLFVARHLIDLFGREAFGGSRDDEQVLAMACTAADTALTGR